MDGRSQLICAETVQLYQLTDPAVGKYAELGTMGLALVGTGSKAFQIVLYRTPEKPVSATLLSVKFAFVIQRSRYGHFTDGDGRQWSLLFKNATAALTFCRHVCLVVARLQQNLPSPRASSKEAEHMVRVPMVLGTGTDVAAGHTVSISYTMWVDTPDAYTSLPAPVTNEPVEEVFVADTSADLRPSIAGLVRGVTGMRCDGRSLLVVPSRFAFGPAGNAQRHVPPHSTLIVEVEVVKSEATAAAPPAAAKPHGTAAAAPSSADPFLAQLEQRLAASKSAPATASKDEAAARASPRRRDGSGTPRKRTASSTATKSPSDATAEDVLKGLRAEREALAATLDAMTAENVELSSRIALLDKQLAQALAQVKDAEQTKAQLEELKPQIRASNKAKEKLQAENAQLLAECQAARAKAAETDTLRAEVGAFREKVRQESEQRLALTTELDALRRAAGGHASDAGAEEAARLALEERWRNEVKRVKSDLEAALSTEQEQGLRALAEKEEEILALRREVDAAKAEVQSAIATAAATAATETQKTASAQLQHTQAEAVLDRERALLALLRDAMLAVGPEDAATQHAVQKALRAAARPQSLPHSLVYQATQLPEASEASAEAEQMWARPSAAAESKKDEVPSRKPRGIALPGAEEMQQKQRKDKGKAAAETVPRAMSPSSSSLAGARHSLSQSASEGKPLWAGRGSSSNTAMSPSSSAGKPAWAAPSPTASGKSLAHSASESSKTMAQAELDSKPAWIKARTPGSAASSPIATSPASADAGGATRAPAASAVDDAIAAGKPAWARSGSQDTTSTMAAAGKAGSSSSSSEPSNAAGSKIAALQSNLFGAGGPPMPGTRPIKRPVAAKAASHASDAGDADDTTGSNNNKNNNNNNNNTVSAAEDTPAASSAPPVGGGRVAALQGKLAFNPMLMMPGAAPPKRPSEQDQGPVSVLAPSTAPKLEHSNIARARAGPARRPPSRRPPTLAVPAQSTSNAPAASPHSPRSANGRSKTDLLRTMSGMSLMSARSNASAKSFGSTYSSDLNVFGLPDSPRGD